MVLLHYLNMQPACRVTMQTGAAIPFTDGMKNTFIAVTDVNYSPGNIARILILQIVEKGS